jgi:hypothetical protein
VLLASVVATAAEPRAHPEAADDPNALTFWEYEDASGLQQTERLEDVPKKYRSKAKRISMSRTYGAGPQERPVNGKQARPGSPGRRAKCRVLPVLLFSRRGPNARQPKAAISCWCTDDTSYISTRCG